MIVQHNLTAMNSNRMLGLTKKSQAKSTEKLSSGYKINRAADDAAGLSISEKMRKQIRGLTQAASNAQDGISAVQTAEGALNEVQDMLQRMNELAVKAANGTNSETDRGYIQNEIDALVTEIDRVSETTKFNETYLLKGEKTTTTTPVGVDVSYKNGIGGAATSVTLATGVDAQKNVANKDLYDKTTGQLAIKNGQILTAAQLASLTTDYASTIQGKVSTAITEGTDANTALPAKLNDYLTVDTTTHAVSLKDGKVLYKADGTTYTTVELQSLFVGNTSTNAIEWAPGAVSSNASVFTEIEGGTAAVAGDAPSTAVTLQVTKQGAAVATVSASNVNDYFEVKDGKAQLKEGYELYNKAVNETGQYGDQLSVFKVDATIYQDLVKASDFNGLFSKNGSTYTAVTATTLGNYFNADGSYKGGLYAKDSSGVQTEVGGDQIDKFVVWTPTGGDDVDVVNPITLSLHVGADGTPDNKIFLDIESMSAVSLGVKANGAAIKVNGADDSLASAAIQTISDAIQKVSEQRSALGAVQNRLEHTINNLDNVVENTTAAEAAIRDTDMATEMVRYSNNNILAQAGQAMLAQSNQANQGVLSLLQ